MGEVMIAKTEAGRLYERVAQDLSGKIAAGQYALGQRLPSERDLAQAYAVSRPTIREAIIAMELDGLVEVRLGSGVYVAAKLPRGGTAGEMDVGPFELLEARRAIEGETCALAAVLITTEQLDELQGLVAEMQAENSRDVVMSEDADRRFHIAAPRIPKPATIISQVLGSGTAAELTENAVMASAVESVPLAAPRR